MKGKKTGSAGRKHFRADPKKAAAARASRQAAVRLGDGETPRPKGSFSSQNRRSPAASGEMEKAPEGGKSAAPVAQAGVPSVVPTKDVFAVEQRHHLRAALKALVGSSVALSVVFYIMLLLFTGSSWDAPKARTVAHSLSLTTESAHPLSWPLARLVTAHAIPFWSA